MQTTTNTTVARDRKEAGFTLIELMVVVLVIGILLAIAVPTFLGARNRANDASARSTLRTALTSAGVVATDVNNGYWNVGGSVTAASWVTALGAAEASIAWTNAATTVAVAAGGKTVDVNVVTPAVGANLGTGIGPVAAGPTPAQVLVLVARSSSSANACHAIIAASTGATSRVIVNTGTASATVAASCNAVDVSAIITNASGSMAAWSTW